MTRMQAKTVDGARNALEIMNDNGDGGPLGNLSEVGVKGLRNDLPFGEGYEQTEEDKLTSILSEVGQEGTGEGLVSIWKLNEQTKKLEFVDRRGASEFETEGLPYLAKNFGAGEYELRIYNSNRKMHARPRVMISQAAVQVANVQTSRQANGGSGGNGDIMQLAKLMQDGFAAMTQALLRPPAQPTETRAQMLQELIQMKTIFGGEKSGADPIAMFGQMATLFKSMQPRPEGDGNMFMELLDRFGPIIADTVKNMQPANATIDAIASDPAAAASPAKIAAPKANPGKPALTPEQMGAAQVSMQLKMQLMYLCTQAARDADPGPYAAIIVEQVPADALAALVNDANWLDALAKFNPNVKKFPEWFGELHDAIIEEMQNNENLTPQPDADIQTATNIPAGGGVDVFGTDTSDGEE